MTTSPAPSEVVGTVTVFMLAVPTARRPSQSSLRLSGLRFVRTRPSMSSLSKTEASFELPSR